MQRPPLRASGGGELAWRPGLALCSAPLTGHSALVLTVASQDPHSLFSVPGPICARRLVMEEWKRGPDVLARPGACGGTVLGSRGRDGGPEVEMSFWLATRVLTRGKRNSGEDTDMGGVV